MDIVAITGGKIVAKVGLNMALPGLGSAVDFGEGIYDITQGNWGSALFNIGSGVFDLVTLGLYGTAKTVAQGSGKNAAVIAVKETSKSSSKQIGKEAGIQIAKGAPKQFTIEMAKSTAKQANKEIGKTFGEEIAKGMLSDATEEAFKRSLLKSVTHEATMGFIGSGGKGVTKDVAEGAARGIAEFFTQSSRQTFSSGTYSAAKGGAKVVADMFFEEQFKRDILFNSSKGFHNYLTR